MISELQFIDGLKLFMKELRGDNDEFRKLLIAENARLLLLRPADDSPVRMRMNMIDKQVSRRYLIFCWPRNFYNRL